MHYQLDGITLDDALVARLAQQGWQPTDATQSTTSADVALVDLTLIEEAAVGAKLAQQKTAMTIALVQPEQPHLASAALANGADDYLLLPLEVVQLELLLQRLLCVSQSTSTMVASAPSSRQLMMLAQRAAMVPATVLLSGESGVGKECFARYIHEHSPRAAQPLVTVNCAAIPDSMLETLLFGHVKGAFTSAFSDKIGKFEHANHGTLLLDEISEMSPALQAKLLRVLQEREVEKLGSHQPIKLDIKVIAATNRDLRAEVAAGRFRQDLFYRLDVLPLHIPPLKERREDILPIAQSLLQRYSRQYNASHCSLSNCARDALLNHDWPGNVRELDNRLQRALVMRHGASLMATDLGFDAVAAAPVGQAIAQSKKQLEFQCIVDVLKQNSGNRSRSAEALGITPRALRYKLAQMRENGIDIDSELKRAANF